MEWGDEEAKSLPVPLFLSLLSFLLVELPFPASHTAYSLTPEIKEDECLTKCRKKGYIKGVLTLFLFLVLAFVLVLLMWSYPRPFFVLVLVLVLVLVHALLMVLILALISGLALSLFSSLSSSLLHLCPRSCPRPCFVLALVSATFHLLLCTVSWEASPLSHR